MDYLVLARKYRSVSFEEVVGQEHICTTLVNAIKTGRLAQAYLFTGTRGVGKTTVARVLAKALNCQSADAPTPTPCNHCDVCEAVGRGEDMDVIEIDGASNRGIDEIRQLRNNVALRPARARYKVYYIDEVHMLTKEAFNALLKTLEEPPMHVKFIFATTEAAKIPATILSRCQRFDFRNIPTSDITAHLGAICKTEKVLVSDDALFHIAKSATGSMRDGISLLDQLISSCTGELTEAGVLRVLGTPPEERIAGLVAAIADGDAAGALAQMDAILSGGYPLEAVATALAEQFRNIMIALTCGPDSKLIELGEASRQALKSVAQKYTTPAAVHAVGVCERLLGSVRGSSCARALVEAAVVRLAAADKFVDPASLIQRLEQLAQKAPGGAVSAQTGLRRQTAPVAGPPSAAPVASPPPAATVGSPPAARITSQQRIQVESDPAVKSVTDLFGGALVDIRHDVDTSRSPEAENEDEVNEAG
ncbi:MAG: DNA polymerase III subunit gamma/tau [Planctomycetes bacterium]|nr:DNA polymerase III subunit gamma/tau [Planctomycetota bacterium]